MDEQSVVNITLTSTMSLCPPFAPFFGFAGVTSAVSYWKGILYSKQSKLIAIDRL